MEKILLTGVAGLAMLVAVPAAAEPNGPYIAGDIGYHWPSTDGELCSGAICVDADVELDGGVAAFGRFGTRLNPAFRLEAELGRRVGSVDTISGAPPPRDTDFDTTSLMANALYDFGSGNVRPFIGAGVGWGSVNVDNGTDEADDSGLAWQLLAGLAMATGPRGNFDITYRYFNVSDLTLDDGTGGAVLNSDYSDHSITIGYRYSFGAIAAPPPPPPMMVTVPPPPPPSPSPPPPPAWNAREFVVLFDWDRFDLTPQATEIVRQAAAHARAGGATRVHVVGHADTSGSAAYNVRLSQRRAATVRDALIAQGVTGGAITTEGRGETDLARATADGVREPLNRRATININR